MTKNLKSTNCLSCGGTAFRTDRPYGDFCSMTCALRGIQTEDEKKEDQEQIRKFLESIKGDDQEIRRNMKQAQSIEPIEEETDYFVIIRDQEPMKAENQKDFLQLRFKKPSDAKHIIIIARDEIFDFQRLLRCREDQELVKDTIRKKFLQLCFSKHSDADYIIMIKRDMGWVCSKKIDVQQKYCLAMGAEGYELLEID